VNVAFDCPECDKVARVEFDAETSALECPHCDHSHAIKDDAVNEETVSRCIVCHGDEMYVRKDFSQRLGVTIICIGLAISCIPWYFGMWYTTYGILFSTAIFDAVLYKFTGNLLQCYRCHSQFRDIPGLDEHGGFDLEVYEKHRQEGIRLRESQLTDNRTQTLGGK